VVAGSFYLIPTDSEWDQRRRGRGLPAPHDPPPPQQGLPQMQSGGAEVHGEVGLGQKKERDAGEQQHHLGGGEQGCVRCGGFAGAANAC
jgi:hypothetical protein